MCGIAGVLHFDGIKPEMVNDLAGKIVPTMQHRGPDGKGACTLQATIDAGLR